MTREIKYRAWDEDNEKMWYWESGYIYNDFWNAVRVHKHIPMECIGLKDKNKKEIYEGDIFNYERHSRYNVDSFIGVVVRHKTQPVFITKPHNLFDADEIEFDVLPYFKIIGNIHDSPELLEGNT